MASKANDNNKPQRFVTTSPTKLMVVVAMLSIRASTAVSIA